MRKMVFPNAALVAALAVAVVATPTQAGCPGGVCGGGGHYGGGHHAGGYYGGGYAGHYAPMAGYYGSIHAQVIVPGASMATTDPRLAGGVGAASLPREATLAVTLPADATLSVDGYVTQSTSNFRLLRTPALQPGQDYSYNLKAEVVRDGKPVVATRKVTVRAGEQTPVSITLPEAAVASK